MKKRSIALAPAPAEPLKLDLACGQRKQPGFVGVDIVKTPQADVVHDLLSFPWPWADGSVGEVWCSHFFEHIPGRLRGKWMDELYRVLAPGGKAVITCPYFASMRATQDFTHEWPPISEASFLYFNKGWRQQNGLDHYPVSCDFDFGYSFVMDAAWGTRADEARAFAMRHYQHVVMDVIVHLTKREPS